MGRTHIFFFCVLLGLAINFPLLSLAAELPDRAADIPLPLTHSVPDPVRLDDFAVADFRTRGFNASRDANRVLLDQYWGPFSTYFKGLSKKVPINKLMEMQAKLRAEADKGSADRLGLFDVSDGCFYRNGMGSQIMEEDLKKMGLTMDEVGATILMKYMPNDEPLNDAEREAFDNWKRSTDKVRQQVASEQQADAAQRMKDDREAREDAQLDAELRVKKVTILNKKSIERKFAELQQRAAARAQRASERSARAANADARLNDVEGRWKYHSVKVINTSDGPYVFDPTAKDYDQRYKGDLFVKLQDWLQMNWNHKKPRLTLAPNNFHTVDDLKPNLVDKEKSLPAEQRAARFNQRFKQDFMGKVPSDPIYKNLEPGYVRPILGSILGFNNDYEDVDYDRWIHAASRLDEPERSKVFRYMEQRPNEQGDLVWKPKLSDKIVNGLRQYAVVEGSPEWKAAIDPEIIRKIRIIDNQLQVRDVLQSSQRKYDEMKRVRGSR